MSIASLITFPYVSRTLNAELIGTVGFVNQAIQYFILFSMLGVNSVGIRAIAECNDDREKRSEAFSSVLSLSLFTTVFVLLVYFLCAIFIPAFSRYRSLFFIGSGTILFTTLQIEWLYRGIENFKYISIRTIIIRALYIVSLFIFVRDKDDYVIYFTLSVFVVVVNAIINLRYSKNFVSFVFSKKTYIEQWKKIYKSYLIIGANNIMNSFYSTFNVIYLGIVCTKDQVGYYNISNQIMSICLGVINAFTMTTLPRMSNLLGTNNKKDYDTLLNNSFNAILNLCIPLSFGLFLYAPNIVNLLSGAGYEQSITPLRIIAPVVTVNAIAQIVVYQILMPQHRDRPILYSTIIASLVGIVTNIIFVKELGVIGSAIVLFLSTLSNLLYNLAYSSKNKLLTFPVAQLFRCLIVTLPFILIYLVVDKLIENELLVLIIGVSVTGLYWLIINRKFVESIIHLRRAK